VQFSPAPPAPGARRRLRCGGQKPVLLLVFVFGSCVFANTAEVCSQGRVRVVLLLGAPDLPSHRRTLWPTRQGAFRGLVCPALCRRLRRATTCRCRSDAPAPAFARCFALVRNDGSRVRRAIEAECESFRDVSPPTSQRLCNSFTKPKPLQQLCTGSFSAVPRGPAPRRKAWPAGRYASSASLKRRVRRSRPSPSLIRPCA
jgi:hypothetical protein